MKTKWMVANKKADFDSIAGKFGIDRVLARIIRNRDITQEKDIDMFLNGDSSCFHDPMLMKDMDKAVSVLKEKQGQDIRIRVIGDYDVDGVCSTFILLKGLKKAGFDVDTVIPHRIRDGYGLNDNLINEAYQDGVDTIVTCDNGISAFDQIELANSLGMCVVVTDHHEVPFEIENEEKRYIIPNAAAVVDPKRADCNYPYPQICGAFVAFKFVQALLGEEFDSLFEELLPFAAMATVCDVMPLLDENRVVVKEGLRLLKNPANEGLRALISVCGLSDKNISAYHLGFVLGPTVNATGRLDTAQRALELFSSKNFMEGATVASDLKSLNEARKVMTDEGKNAAIAMIESESMLSDRVLVIFLPEFHESIAGIIAGRIKEKYNRPTIVFTNAEEGIKGSGRSIETYDMFAELSKVKDLFTKFGGHPMAAGMSLRSEKDIEELRRRLNENCLLTDEDMVKMVHVDVPMPLSYISMPLIESFELLEPTGTGNPKPLFATAKISLLSYEKKGKNRVIGKLRIADETDCSFDMVYFEDLSDFDEFLVSNFGNEVMEKLMAGRCLMNEAVIKIVYYPDINEFNGRKNVQLIMKYYDI